MSTSPWITAVPADARVTGLSLRRWIGVVTAAEFGGFLLPAAVGAITADAAAGVAVPALVAAGAVEGAALGLGQAAVLRAVVPGLSVPRWVGATAAAAAVAYLLGLLPSILLSPWALTGLAALPLTIGFAQWLVLRRHVRRSAGWIAVTAMAWVAGLAAFLAIATPLWHEGQAVAETVAVGAVAGLAMAAIVAMITGLGLREILR
ncbi:hypothetical protein [Actinokineospora fastidiosa]|uniref:Uncharacterized protein n=1 Tax=Actinokineospora fastidiosa TaxID=1816 RepID=A0A918LC69_9PSEU|nr:hypothetical protein [Actinokineospora fastidiosa]GGS28527.1 hypothetical protein GCM10010171_22030 [Actinokineospora fastidiosa]